MCIINAKNIRLFFDYVYKNQKVFLLRKRERFDQFIEYKRTAKLGRGVKNSHPIVKKYFENKND